MKRKLGAALAALALAAASVAPATPAFADDYRHGEHHGDWGGDRRGDRNWDGDRNSRHGGDWDGDRGRRDYRYSGRYDDGYYRHRDRNDHDDAVAAGVIGLALGAVLGAAIASDQHAGPPPRHYSYDDSYDRGRTCYRRERQWDRYAGRYVTVDVPYSC